MTTVLIIEDDPMVQFIHKSYLNKIDAALIIKTSQTAKEAVNLLNTYKIQLILLDVKLNDSNGLDLLKKIRQQGYPAEVILITAASDTAVVQQSRHLGVLDYLIKPFTFKRFANSIATFKKNQQLFQTTQLQQTKIDHVFHSTPESTDLKVNLTKGLSQITLKLICAKIKEQKKPFTAESLAKQLNLSHVTVRKYIAFLEKHHVLTSKTVYLKVGRPYQIYQLNLNSPLYCWPALN